MGDGKGIFSNQSFWKTVGGIAPRHDGWVLRQYRSFHSGSGLTVEIGMKSSGEFIRDTLFYNTKISKIKCEESENNVINSIKAKLFRIIFFHLEYLAEVAPLSHSYIGYCELQRAA